MKRKCTGWSCQYKSKQIKSYKNNKVNKMETSFARHNIEKRRLIDLVHLNPILWDCRLPHYKRSDKKKAIKWNELGRVFNVSGERVQRTFTSLREIFRRELNHEKLLGSHFKSKWEYYDAMTFLKEVIRERKSRERPRQADLQQHSNNSSAIDEYQYFAPNDPNNPNNQHQPKQTQKMQQTNTQKENVNTNETNIQQSTNTSQPDVVLGINNNKYTKRTSNGGPPSPHTISTIPSCSSSPSIYIKEEDDDEENNLIIQTPPHPHNSNKNSTPIENANNLTNQEFHNQNFSMKSKQNKIQQQTMSNNLINDIDIDDDDLVDDDVEMIDDHLSSASTLQVLKHQPTAREILYTKFGEFLSARLNTLNETAANDLINKILLLIAEK
ncbi:putative uncharacterized protein DDB_G0282133 [Teleopsis dalmanni]|uniref:putative uncharacterized protein DDB_G0282133 n=1 Tax=Teleopsis dalmanni TaxID=139649 RepID=UPI0018CC9942|nr:putative uncharacterized protein DDB_G0282133 [Teleopsis dalmanni]XP_037939960.1 putative uncharacterized protein DDB_G0282133 [Teleopsis dalmanni]